MRVLLVHNAYREPGGEDAVVAAEHALLAAHGHEVALFTASNEAVGGALSRLKVAWRAPYSAAARDALAARIAAFSPDVVHVHNFFPLLTPSLYDACRAAGVAVVQTLHNYRLLCPVATLMRRGRVCELCLTGSAYQAVLHGCYRESRQATLAVARMIERHRRLGTWRTKVERFIALTEFARRKFVAGGLPPERLTVKPNFAADPGEPAPGRREGALYVGRLSPEKGVETLLAAWRSLAVPLRVVGDGPLAEVLARACPPTVSLLGRLPPAEVGREMARAAFLVVPSHCYEGFPMVVVEAYARGLPVLASGHGALAEVVEDGVTGRHVAPADAADLAAKAAWAAANPETLAAMGRAARARFRARYDAPRNHERLLAIYGQARAQRHAAPKVA